MALVIAAALLALFARDLWEEKPRPSPERQLGDAIARYLESMKK